MPTEQDLIWVGVDIGKTHHWVCAVDSTGRSVLSRKVANDETDPSPRSFVLETDHAIRLTFTVVDGRATQVLLEQGGARIPGPRAEPASPPPITRAPQARAAAPSAAQAAAGS